MNDRSVDQLVYLKFVMTLNLTRIDIKSNSSELVHVNR